MLGILIYESDEDDWRSPNGPSSSYDKLVTLKKLSANYNPNLPPKGILDVKSSLGLPKYTAIRVGDERSIVITTLRAAGNIIFGANMYSTRPTSTSSGDNWYHSKFMQVVGQYNQDLVMVIILGFLIMENIRTPAVLLTMLFWVNFIENKMP